MQYSAAGARGFYKIVGRYFSTLLTLVSVALVAFPGDRSLLLGSLSGSVASLLLAWILIFELREVRIAWLLADAILFGYATGTANTLLRNWIEGGAIADYVAGRGAELSLALALCTFVSASLLLVGLLERPLVIDPAKIRGADRIVIWVGLLLVLSAFLTGNLGFMGITVSADHRVTLTGALAGLLAPVLPAQSVLMLNKCRRNRERFAIWIAVAIEIVLLVPQGRRTLLYATVVTIFALNLTSLVKTTRPKKLMLVAAAAGFVYIGTTCFSAIRYFSGQSTTTQVSLADRASLTVEYLRDGRDSGFQQELNENLRERTFVLSYISDLVAQSPNHEPLYGRDALFCMQTAIPSVFYPNKAEVTDIGMEEAIANPQFGLPVEDDANSILTTGTSDFGVAGSLIYPLMLAFALSMFLRFLGRCVPTSVKALCTLAAMFLMLQTEVPGSQYIGFFRDISLVSTLSLAFVGTTRIRKLIRESASSHKLFGRSAGKHAAVCQTAGVRPL